MARGKFMREWIPFVDALKHTIKNESLLCIDQRGTIRLCKFENERFVTLEGAPIENVSCYQNNKVLYDIYLSLADYYSKQ